MTAVHELRMVQSRTCSWAGRRVLRRATRHSAACGRGASKRPREDVGTPPRHHTFFEMTRQLLLRRHFSSATPIRFAWELLTKVYQAAAGQAVGPRSTRGQRGHDLWRRRSAVPKDRCVRIGDKAGRAEFQRRQLLAMADTGPCGPLQRRSSTTTGPRSRARAPGSGEGRRRPLHRDLEA